MGCNLVIKNITFPNTELFLCMHKDDDMPIKAETGAVGKVSASIT